MVTVIGFLEGKFGSGTIKMLAFSDFVFKFEDSSKCKSGIFMLEAFFEKLGNGTGKRKLAARSRPPPSPLVRSHWVAPQHSSAMVRSPLSHRHRPSPQ
jgi:hypothetical protein